MSGIKLNLINENLFKEDELLLDKKLTFIFGKNGTGKSTLVKILKEQVNNYNVSIFQGFEKIVGEDKKLNAVVLGESNVEIDKQISTLEKEIEENQSKIDEIRKETEKNEEIPDNLWKEVQDKQIKANEQKKKINDFYKNSARDIKNSSDPQIASTSYNLNDFKKEINKAQYLSEELIKTCKQTLLTEIKTASTIVYEEMSFENLLLSLNQLLVDKVEERETIIEIHGNKEKINFAEDGLRIHKPNDECSFCGNIISEARFKKLQNYFSADEVKEFRNKIQKYINSIDDSINEIKKIKFEENEFYPEYIPKVNNLNSELTLKKNSILDFLNNLKNRANDKLKNLFETDEEEDWKIPESLTRIITIYDNLMKENNSSNLAEKKKKSRELLRYHEVKKKLEEFGYEENESIHKDLVNSYNISNSLLDDKNKQITELEAKIIIAQEQIKRLQDETKSEKRLAEKINEKLSVYINFNLEYVEDAEKKGHYRVRCKNTSELRDITQLSTGEKNIIAFLYFINKLEEVDSQENNLPKLIIFDDPMTSNDDTMQYLIIEELNSLIDKLDEANKIIIMTHNNHFYLNVKYKYNFKNGYKKNIYLRLCSDGIVTSIVRLDDPKEDFKTNYEALWHELKYIYHNAPSESDSMLLNPIRRIIETFTNFNKINKNNMLGHVSGAAKLFNVNSHSIDDLEADLNGRTRKQIMQMMKRCFEGENTQNHFNQYCKLELDLNESEI